MMAMRAVQTAAARSRSVLVLLALACLPRMTQGIHFELQGRTQKCLGEQVERNDLVIGKFSNTENRQLTVTVTDQMGIQLFSKTAPKGRYSITANRDGEHVTCIFNTENVPVMVEFEIKMGIGAKDYSGIAEKDSLKPLELELLRLEDIIKYIQDEFVRMETNEREQSALNASTNSRVFWLSIFSMFCVVGINAAQIYFLLQYFKDKRLKDA